MPKIDARDIDARTDILPTLEGMLATTQGIVEDARSDIGSGVEVVEALASLKQASLSIQAGMLQLMLIVHRTNKQ